MKEVTIVGGGLAGCLLSWNLHCEGVKVYVYDDQDPFSSSKVAAGVINPVSGMRLAKNWRLDELLPIAENLYQSLEETFSRQFFVPIPIYRMLKNAKEEKIIEKRLKDPEYEEYLELANFYCNQKPVLKIKHGAYIKIDELTQAIRNFFLNSGQWFDERWGPSIQKTDHIIFCQGYRGKDNPDFSNLPFRLSRGETLMIESDLDFDYLMNSGKWIFPWDKQNQLFRAGATYQWKDLQDPPSEEARNEIIQGINPFIQEKGASIKIKDQFVGIRSNTQNNMPLIGQHLENKNHYIFNGFGSKGAMTIPWCAQKMTEFLTGKIDHLPEDLKLYPKEIKKVPRIPLTITAQNKIAEILKEGATCVDATVGNGHDTAFLANAVGTTGLVIGFDIQADAIQSTQKRLSDKKLEKPVKLFTQGHENLGTALTSLNCIEIQACMFNLGYLPHGKKDILTLPQTTKSALNQAIEKLAKGGRITILVYVGHEGGNAELEIVEEIFANLNKSDFDTEIIHANVQNPKSKPPILYILTKR